MASVKRLILASASPWRRQLLASAGVNFDVQTAPVDEEAINADDPLTLARLRAEAKALAVAHTAADALVVGCDQVLGLGGESYGKAPDAATARARLAAFAGRTHELHSAFALAVGAGSGGRVRLAASRVVTAAMPMRPLSDSELDAYVATGEWRGSAGCYQYEGRGVHLFDGVVADHSTIIGLPLAALFAELRRLGIDALSQPSPPWTLGGR